MSETEYGSLQDIVDTQALERPADAAIGADGTTADGTATVAMPHDGAKPALAGTQNAATETMDPVTAPAVASDAATETMDPIAVPAVASDAATETMDPIGQPHAAPDAATETIALVNPAPAGTSDAASHASDVTEEDSTDASAEPAKPGAPAVSVTSTAQSTPAHPTVPPVWTAQGVREATAMPKLAPDPSLPVDGSVPATTPDASPSAAFSGASAAHGPQMHAAATNPAANAPHAMPQPPLNAPAPAMGGARPVPPNGFSGPAMPAVPGVGTPQSEPEPKRPTGVSVPTVLFGLCGILLGVTGIMFGWELVNLPSILASLDMQKAVAMVCAGIGVLLIIAGIVWSVSSVVTKRRKARGDGQKREGADRAEDGVAEHAAAAEATDDAPKVGRKE